MTRITDQDQLRQAVMAATGSAWPAFAAEHPALARTIDQAALGTHLTRSLADDPAFVNAYVAAVEANVAPRVLACLVERFVTPALRRLL